MNVAQQITSPIIKVSKSDLHSRLRELGPCSETKDKTINWLIKEILGMESNGSVLLKRLELSKMTYHDLFIGDEITASLILIQGDDYEIIFSKAKAILSEGKIDKLYIPFTGGKETVVVTKNMTNVEIGCILAGSYFLDRDGYKK